MNTQPYFHEAFENMNRLGPGSRESTLHAISFYPNRLQKMKILDLGCGIGAHTFLLAEQFPNAEIVAIDIYAPYIEQLNKDAKQRGLSHRVHGLVMSMFELSFEKGSFDLLWAEGMEYIPVSEAAKSGAFPSGAYRNFARKIEYQALPVLAICG